MGKLCEGRAVFGFPGPGVFISGSQPPLTLLGDADANASTAVRSTRRYVLLVNVVPKCKENIPAFRQAQKKKTLSMFKLLLLTYCGTPVTLISFMTQHIYLHLLLCLNKSP